MSESLVEEMASEEKNVVEEIERVSRVGGVTGRRRGKELRAGVRRRKHRRRLRRRRTDRRTEEKGKNDRRKTCARI